MTARRSKYHWLIGLAAILVALAGCNRVPDHVIPPDRMASLMADMRVADAVVGIRPQDYRSEASKLALKEAVLRKHGVTQQQMDTSLVWYGHNIGRYQEVTQQSIEILEDRLDHLGAVAAGESAITVAGDSVDLWTGAEMYRITRRSPGQYITFSFDNDQNWERGDIYTLRSRFVTPIEGAQWNITAWYDDGAIESSTALISVAETGKQEISLYTDSTRTATRVSGWLRIDVAGHKPAVIDSISLTRRRLADGSTSRRRQQRLILPPQNHADTTTADSR